MRTILGLLAILTAHAAYGQMRPVRTGPDLADLYSRVSDSVFVLKGRLLARKVFLRTDLPPAVQVGPNLWKAPPIEIRSSSGTLYTLSVEQVLCRQADLAVEAPATVDSPSFVHIFVPGSEIFFSPKSKYDPNRRDLPESFLPDREYLLFLYEPRGPEAMVKLYGLDPSLTYFRTVERERGAVALPDAEHPEKARDFVTPLVQAVTTFCEALKAPDAATKIRQLQAIRDYSKDPAWQKSVDQAIYDFQNPAPRRPQP